MANGSIPAYLAMAEPNPATNRAPWFKNTAQAYAGIFLWIAFFDQLAGSGKGPGALGMFGIPSYIMALIAAGVIAVVLFYAVPGILGMKTGLPLYVVGTSTFGTKGGYFLPGFFMGVLQIGWYSVATYYAADMVLKGIGQDAHAVSMYGGGGKFDIVFVLTTVVWGYAFAFLGAKGLKYVAAVSTFFPIVIIIMLIIGAVAGIGYLGDYDRAESAETAFAAAKVVETEQKIVSDAGKVTGKSTEEIDKAVQQVAKNPADLAKITAAKLTLDEGESGVVSGMKLAGTFLVIAMVIGFFATAGAAGADFCTANRNTKDVWYAGFTGVGLVIVFAGGLAALTVAGAHGKLLGDLAGGKASYGDLVNYTYGGALPIVSPGLGKIMLIVFAIGSVAPACFCAFIIGNSLSTMLGKPNSRVPITLAGVTVGIVLAALGVAGNLAPFFGLIGASFGPVLGAMAADYLLSGRKWAGPRAGVSVPGYAAWLIGFAVGICNNSIVTGLIGKELIAGWHPASVYSFVVGFVVYAVLAKMGLEGKVVDVPNLTGAPAAAAPEAAPAPAVEAAPAEAPEAAPEAGPADAE